MTGLVFHIQRFSIHDGPGIRTTVFLKGCPLRCVWCHNPEGYRAAPELSYAPEKCIGCRFCQRLCPRDGHQFDGPAPGHAYDRARCTVCGACAAGCPTGALEVVGTMMSIDEVLDEVEKDRAFYAEAGGMTLSGGEPLAQHDFTAALLAAGRRRRLHTCLETCGHAPWALLQSLAPDVDLFLYDLKETDPHLHEQFTGVDNRLILANLAALDRLGARLILRCPIVPGLNDRDEHLASIAALAARLEHVEAVHLLPYHPLGHAKARHLGRSAGAALEHEPADPEARQRQWDRWRAAVQARTRVPTLCHG